MDKRALKHFPIAVLSAAVSTPVIAADAQAGFAALSLQPGSDGWCQLLPAGKFKAIDGRPKDTPDGHWFLDQETAEQLIADLRARQNETVIDYEHQTLLSDTNGQAAPASGWFSDAQWRESGLWIKPRWTPRATGYIENGEYAYLSAVFPYDPKTGKPLSLHSAALVNRAGLDGMNAVALSAINFHQSQPNTNPEDSPMLKALLIALGLSEDATEQDAVAAINALKAAAGTDEQKEAVAQLAALKAAGTDATPDPEKYVPMSVYTDLQGQMASLSATTQANEVDSLIATARADGRLTAASEDYARDLGKKNLASLKTFLDACTPVAALSGMQTDSSETQQPGKTGAEGLSDEELTAARLTGRTPAEFAALKAADK